jgi:hypothetical protein
MKEEIIHLNRKTLLQILSKLQKPILITRISEDQSLDKPTNDISHNNAKSENQNSFDPEFDSGWRTYIVLDSTLLLLTMERIHARIHPAQEQLKSKLTGEEKKMYPSEERSPASL